MNGDWRVEEMPEAPSGKRVLVQRAAGSSPAPSSSRRLSASGTPRAWWRSAIIQGWLDGRLLLDHRDTRFRIGRVGLWAKADSVTAFDDLTIRGVG